MLADALSFAHERGVLHRDVKPQNVLVLPTSWVLTDFGIARLVGSEHTSSAETFTYRHAAPQILDGQPPTAADDIWSLGSTLYTLLDGRPPFASGDPDDDSALAYLRRARTEPPRPLAVAGAERIASVIARCLSKDTAGRWGSAAELRDALLALRTSAWEPGGASTAVPLAAAPAPASPPPTPSGSTVGPRGTAGHHLDGARRATPTTAPTAPADTGGLDASPTVVTTPDRPRPGCPAAPDADERRSTARDGRRQGGGRRTSRVGRSRLPIVLGVVALVVGLVLGIVGRGAAGRRDGPDAVGHRPDGITGVHGTHHTRCTLDHAAGGTRHPGPGPGARPDADDGRTRDGILRLKWTDPSEGEGRFNLVEIVEDGASVPCRDVPRRDSASADSHCRCRLGDLLQAGRETSFSAPYGLSDLRCVDVPG